MLLIALAATLAASSPSPSSAAFCNTTGFPHCDTRNGTSCISPGVSVRCIAYPAYCEWGVCRCTTSYTWNCVY